MGTLRISQSAGLQEWVAEQKGYFKDEGLDYEFIRNEANVNRTAVESVDHALPQIVSGAFESIEAGRTSDVSFACHWAVNMAASGQKGQMWGHAYMLTNAGIMVAPESPIRKPEDLRGIEIGVGYHSGSHFSCVQTLQPIISPDDLKLSFIGGPSGRLDLMVDRKIQAANMWGTQKDILDQMGFRKIVDTTYMQGFLVTGDIDVEDYKKYFRALQRAQRDVDAGSEKYREYFLTLVPDKYRDQVDVRAFSPGKRIVFEPYTKEVYDSTHQWMESINIFPEAQLGHADYEDAILV